MTTVKRVYLEHAFKLTGIAPVCGASRWKQGYTIPRYWYRITCKRCLAKKKAR